MAIGIILGVVLAVLVIGGCVLGGVCTYRQKERNYEM